MTDIADLERRVTALEAAQTETAETQTWMASTLGRIAAVQDEHTRHLVQIVSRLDKIDTRFDKIENRLGKVETEITSFRRDLPSIVADAVREGMKER